MANSLGKLDTNHSVVIGIKVCSNDGPVIFPRADDNENSGKISMKCKKKIFGMTEPIPSNLGKEYPWVNEIAVWSNLELQVFSRGNNNEITKIHDEI